ncbi:tryptophan 2-C-methyltransferase [Streptomyces tateyamensis]|uniref:Tryptophan 2-C-methyltransferase n=1 Tax=Streptomyces tateyamensis TaxID=565073 RepID=A0A2V4P9V9_9ACTN|nr:tryptophan 2-C-methyltransferase [Streptomyces tateyamensis]AXG25756.1 tryptophan 2-C-methyltransferase [Streptomyces tateyamensis]PYC80227.1 tryptophan 2-C-methyltransferase [Streptomyces tateyamensis]
MNRGLITLVNPNKVHPPIAPYALDVLGTALERTGFAVEVVDLTFHRDDWRTHLREYFADRSPLLVGVTIRNTDTVYAFEQRPFVGEHKEIVGELRRLTGAPIVGGGIGFSTMPFALVDYLGLEYGVKGPGEEILCELADALACGRDPGTVAGLIRNTPAGVTRVPPPALTVGTRPPALPGTGAHEPRVWQVDREGTYLRRTGTPFKVDNLAYYRRGGMAGILTKSGCTYRCSHCVEPDAKGIRFARRDVAAVVDEMQSLAAHGIFDQHTTDSEFNLAIGHSKNVLREIVRRKRASRFSPLHQLRLWVYCQPSPFDEELAGLLAEAGCAGVNVGTDHVRADLLRGWKTTEKGTTYYTFADTERLVRLCHANGMLTMVEALLGMPGETEATVRECVSAFMALDATVTAFSLGLRLFPYIPMGIAMAEQCAGVRTLPGLQSNTATGPIVLKPLAMCSGPVEYERQFMFDERGEFRLVCYFSPELTEDPGTVDSPTGRWYRTVDLLWSLIDPADHYRVMLPTALGDSEHDNNYADNPFLTSLTVLGYTGAFWAHWRDREAILREAREAGIVARVGAA